MNSLYAFMAHALRVAASLLTTITGRTLLAQRSPALPIVALVLAAMPLKGWSAPNVAPVNTLPASFTATEDVGLSLAGLSIADSDAGSGTMTVTLSVTSGTLTATTGGGVTVTGSGSSSLVLSGTLANINAFLTNAGTRPVFTTALNATASVTLTMLTNDNGNTGTGGARTDSDTRTITVTPVNDPPVLMLGPNLVTNGSFESGSTGWTNNSGFEANAVTSYGVPTAPNGTKVAEVEGTNLLSPTSTASYLQQTITTVVGQTYLFSVQAITRMDVNTADRGILNVAGTNLLSFTTGTTWVNYAVQFTATSTSTVIRILSNGSTGANAQPGDAGGLVVDDVHVQVADNSTTYTENGSAVAIAPATSVLTDPDNANMTSATITLTNPQTGDRLLVNGSSAASGTLGSGIAWTRTNTLVTLSGSFTQAQYVAALQLIQFESTSDTPDDAVVRDITSTVNDGALNSNTAHTYITVVQANDPPVNTLPTPFSTPQEVPLSLAGLSIADPDAGSGTITITLSVTSGLLTATTGGGVTVTNSGTSSITLSGTLANLNTFLGSATTRPVFTPVFAFTGAVTLTMVTNDNGNTGGSALSDTDNATINVTAANRAPWVALGANQVTNGSFESGTTGWTNNSGVDVGVVGTYGVPATSAGTQVGEVEGTASLAPTSTASVLSQTITTVVGRTYLFSIQAVNRVGVNAADRGYLNVGGTNVLSFNTGNTWGTFYTTFTATSTSTVISIVSNGSASGTNALAGDSKGLVVDDIRVTQIYRYATFTENGSAIPVAFTSDVIIDPDNANMASATVTLTNQQTGDRMLVNGSNAGSGTVNGIPYTRTPTTVTLTGSFTKAQYATALQQIQFENTREDPNAAVVRDVTVVVNDGTTASNTAHTYITVVAVNDPPVANDDSFTLDQGSSLMGQDVSGNDSDLDHTNAQLIWSLVSGGTAAANGTLTVNTDGTFDYTPNSSYNGTVTFTYQACDPLGACGTATVTIVVKPYYCNVGLYQVMANGSGSATDFRSVNTTVMPCTYTTISSLPSIALNGMGYNVRDGYFYATANEAGAHYLYRINASTGAFTNTGLLLSGGSNAGDCDTSGHYFVKVSTNTYIRVDLATLTYSAVTLSGISPVDFAYLPSTRKFYGIQNGLLYEFDLNANTTTTYALTLPTAENNFGAVWMRSDGMLYGLSNNTQRLWRVNVSTRQVEFVGTGSTATNNDGAGCAFTSMAFAPYAENDTLLVARGTTLNGDVTTNDADGDDANSELTWGVQSGGTAAANGTLTVNGDGSFQYTPNPSFVGTVSFTYQTCDPGPLCGAAEVFISVFSPLPVELLSFDGWDIGPVDHLVWRTASERDCDRFEVERSADAEHFEHIGTVAGAGTTQQVHDYMFDDAMPLDGANYYRLRQVDTDGAFEYTPTVVIMRGQGTERDARLVPVDGAGLYMLDRMLGESAQADLVNEQGQTIAGAAQVDNGRCTVDLRTLPVALYLLRVNDGDRLRTYKVMAVH